MNPVEIIVGVGIGGIIVALIQAVVARRKLAADTDKAGAEASSVIAATALSLVTPLKNRIQELEEQLDRVSAKARTLEDQLDAAHAREAAGQAREAAKDALISQLTREDAPR